MIYFSQYSTHSVLLRFQCRFRSERYYPGCSPPQPAACHVGSDVPKSGKACKIAKRKTVTTNTQPRYKNCQPKAVTGIIGCTSGQTRWCMQKSHLERKVFYSAGKRKRFENPPDPFPLVQFLFYAIRTNTQAKKQKEIPLHRMTGTRGSHFDRKKEAASLQRSTAKCRNRQ